MSGTDNATLFDAAIPDTTPINSTDQCSVSEQRSQVTVFCAPVGASVTCAVQILDPTGVWQTLVSQQTTTGNCDGQVIPNPGRLRVRLTATGACTCRVWTHAAGS